MRTALFTVAGVTVGALVGSTIARKAWELERVEAIIREQDARGRRIANLTKWIRALREIAPQVANGYTKGSVHGLADDIAAVRDAEFHDELA